MLVAFAVGPALQVRGRQADRRGRRLLQHPHAVRRLQVRHRSSTPTTWRRSASTWTSSPATYERTGPQTRHPAHLPGRRHLQRGRRRQGARRPPSRSTSRWRSADSRSTCSRTATRPSSPSGTARARSSSTGAGAVAAARRATSPRPARSRCMDGYRDKNGKKDQLGFQALVRADLRRRGTGTMFSQFPALDFPVLDADRLPRQPGRRRGHPAERVPARHSRKMKQFKDAEGQTSSPERCGPARP